MDAQSLRVASWPGYTARHNPFVHLFLNGLADAGCTVSDLDSVEAIEAICASGQADVILLHWAERVYGESKRGPEALAKMWRLVRALKRRPAHMRVVWLVHNLMPHDARPMQRLAWPFYTRGLARQIDGFMTLSPATLAQVRATMPGLAGKPALGLHHPLYPGAALSADERARARAERGWGEKIRVMGYCGVLRPYKGVEDLVAAFRAQPGQDLRLLIAGRPFKADYAAALKRQIGDDTRILPWFGNLSPEEFRTALGICDTVVAPLRDYLHSGSITHALSAGRPVLTPQTPFAAALRDLAGPGWLRLYQGPLTPDLLSGGLDPAPAAGPDLAALDPGLVGRQAADFLRGLARP